MTRRIRAALLGICVVLMAPAAATASTIFIDFEAFVEGDTPSGPGVTFTNASILTSGAIGGGLNELDFPPRSDFNVAFDVGSPLTLEFSSPIIGFSGYFTYVANLTLTAFKGAAVVDTETSSSSNNTAGMGTPNELLSLASAGGITRIEIVGVVGGGSFTLDDVTLEIADVVAPEPTTVLLLGVGAAAFVRRRVRGEQA